MRRKIVAGNWKMNLDPAGADALFAGIQNMDVADGVELMVFPPSIYIDRLVKAGGVKIGAQDGYIADYGAFTGEVSMSQLKAIGASAVLVGHSERREYFNEDNDTVRLKTEAALNHGLEPIFCCGEPLEIREAGTYLQYVHHQLECSLFRLPLGEFVKTIIAYEPIWAIGTGLTATTTQAEEMHKAIRSWIRETYNDLAAAEYPILYGGSCNPSNAAALFACPNVDGGLIGGASLKESDFAVLAAPATWNTLN